MDLLSVPEIPCGCWSETTSLVSSTWVISAWACGYWGFLLLYCYETLPSGACTHALNVDVHARTLHDNCFTRIWSWYATSIRHCCNWGICRHICFAFRMVFCCCWCKVSTFCPDFVVGKNMCCAHHRRKLIAEKSTCVGHYSSTLLAKRCATRTTSATLPLVLIPLGSACDRAAARP